jgi:hypothetical protein
VPENPLRWGVAGVVIPCRQPNRGSKRRSVSLVAMPRTYLIFGDIEGKLDVLRVECSKCARNGRYQVHKLMRCTAAGATRVTPRRLGVTAEVPAPGRAMTLRSTLKNASGRYPARSLAVGS